MKNSKQNSKNAIFLKLKSESFLLSPLRGVEDISLLEDITILSSSSHLSNEEREGVDDKLLHDARLMVSRYIQDKHYLPRLFISAAVFLLFYLFFSLVIRDPLPMVDEILLSLVFSLLVWIFLSRKDTNTALSSKLMLDLKDIIYNAPVEASDEVFEVESYLFDMYNRYSIPELADILSFCHKDPLFPLYGKNLSQEMKELFSLYLKEEKVLASYLKMVKKNSRRSESLSARLVRSATLEALDLPLLAFLLQVL